MVERDEILHMIETSNDCVRAFAESQMHQTTKITNQNIMLNKVQRRRRREKAEATLMRLKQHESEKDSRNEDLRREMRRHPHQDRVSTVTAPSFELDGASTSEEHGKLRLPRQGGWEAAAREIKGRLSKVRVSRASCPPPILCGAFCDNLRVCTRPREAGHHKVSPLEPGVVSGG